MKILCNKCNTEITSQGFKKHYKTCDGSGPKIRNKGKGKNWAKGKSYEEIYGEEKANLLKLKLKNRPQYFIGHSEETKKNISDKMKGNSNWKNSVHKSGRGKKGYYNGYYYMSSWELAYIIYCLDHSIKFERVWESFDYTYKGVKRKYIPDFYLIEEDCYIEIKGYESSQWDSKLNAFPHNIKVLYKNDIKPYLEYVINKYGSSILKK